MSLLNSKINNLEAEILSIGEGKAPTLFPTFKGTATFSGPVIIKDGTSDELASFSSPNIVFNKPVICNSSLSAPLTAQQKKYVDDSITALINGAPTSLDTLKELAAALGNDSNLAANLLSKIANLNNLINLNANTNFTNLNTNGKLLVGQYNPYSGITQPLLTLDPNSLNILNGQFVVDASSGVQTTNSLYNKSSIDALLNQYYKKADASGISNMLNNVANQVNTLSYSYTVQHGYSSVYYKLGTLTLPQGGHHAIITMSLNYGYNISSGINQYLDRMQNYKLEINLYSANGSIDPSYTGGFPSFPVNPYRGSSRIVDPESKISNTDISYWVYGIFYSGFVHATTVFPTPLGVYLACTSDPLNKVDIWIKSWPLHGVPLVEIKQTAGSFDKTFGWSSSIPQRGWIQLDIYQTSLINVYENPRRVLH